jgi:hypothetical protein
MDGTHTSTCTGALTYSKIGSNFSYTVVKVNAKFFQASPTTNFQFYCSFYNGVFTFRLGDQTYYNLQSESQIITFQILYPGFYELFVHGIGSKPVFQCTFEKNYGSSTCVCGEQLFYP